MHSGFALLQLVSALCLGGSALGCLYLLTAAATVLRFLRRDHPPAAVAAPPAITILKPLHGAEPNLARRLRAYCEQDYEAPTQIIFGLQARHDAAVEIAEAVARSVPHAELVIGTRRRGTNPKISNLLNLLPHARHDVLVIADSDIEVGPDYLKNLAAELDRPGVGAVSCLYHGVANGGAWAKLAALAITSHFLPNAVLALNWHLAQPCFGATIALRRAVLTRIGGLEAFADSLADDYEIGTAVRAAGYQVAVPGFTVGHVCFERSLGELFAHDLRAARTIKNIDPLGYYGAVITHPLPLALLGLPAYGSGALWLAVLALACRIALCLSVATTCKLGHQPYWLVPFRDLLSFAVFVRSLFGGTVGWRGASYRVSWSGRLMPDRTEAEP